MEKQLHHLFIPVSDREMKKLTEQVRETLAGEIVNYPGGKFTSAELWNIQRSKKRINNRRHLA